MPIIYLDIARQSENEFTLFQTKEVGFDKQERKWNIETNDLLNAWLLNIGYACKYFYDKEIVNGVIVLDGNTEIEIDIYNVLSNKHLSYKKFVAKHGNGYFRLFKRIMELIDIWRIQVKINNSGMEKPQANIRTDKKKAFIKSAIKRRNFE